MSIRSRTPRWAVALTATGASLALAAGVALAALGALPKPKLPSVADALPSTPYTVGGTVAGLALLMFGGWLIMRIRRGARRRRRQSTKRPRAGRGARGPAAVPPRGDGGGGAAAITQVLTRRALVGELVDAAATEVFARPSSAAGLALGGHPAGQAEVPPAAWPAPSSRPRVVREACVDGTVAALDRGAGAATTDTLPAIRDPQTWVARADATDAGLHEIQT